MTLNKSFLGQTLIWNRKIIIYSYKYEFDSYLGTFVAVVGWMMMTLHFTR